MTYGTRIDHYPATSKLLHWLVAACVLITAPVAIAMTRIDKGPTQDALYNINRLAAGALAPEAEIKPWQKTSSSVVHTSLYVLLLAMPVVGYIANSAYGATTPFFGLFELPRVVGQNEELATRLFWHS